MATDWFYDKALLQRYSNLYQPTISQQLGLGGVALQSFGNNIDPGDFTRPGTNYQTGSTRPFFGQQPIVTGSDSTNELYGIGVGIVQGTGPNGQTTPWDFFNALYLPDAEGISTNTRRVNLNNDEGKFDFFDYLNLKTQEWMNVNASSPGSANWVAARRAEQMVANYYGDPNVPLGEAPGIGQGIYYRNEFDTMGTGFDPKDPNATSRLTSIFNQTDPNGAGIQRVFDPNLFGGTTTRGNVDNTPGLGAIYAANGGAYYSSGIPEWKTQNTILSQYTSESGVAVQKAAFIPIGAFRQDAVQGALYNYNGSSDSMPFGVVYNDDWLDQSLLGSRYQGSTNDEFNNYGPASEQGIRGLPSSAYPDAFSPLNAPSAMLPHLFRIMGPAFAYNAVRATNTLAENVVAGMGGAPALKEFIYYQDRQLGPDGTSAASGYYTPYTPAVDAVMNPYSTTSKLVNSLIGASFFDPGLSALIGNADIPVNKDYISVNPIQTMTVLGKIAVAAKAEQTAARQNIEDAYSFFDRWNVQTSATNQVMNLSSNMTNLMNTGYKGY